MKKKCVLMLLVLIFSMLLISCDPELHKGKVYYVAVALNYDIAQKHYYKSGGAEVSDGKKLGILDYGALAGTVNDVLEFSCAYNALLDVRNTEHESYFFIQHGAPWYPELDCSYTVTPYTGSNTFVINSQTAVSEDCFASFSNAYVNFVKTHPFAPTKENIVSFITGELKDKVEKDDLVVFYYSGHGATSDGAMQVLPEVPENWQEGDIVFPLSNKASYKENAGCMDFTPAELFEALNTLKCKKAVILDSCHSGYAIDVAQSGFYETGMEQYIDSSASLKTNLFKGLTSSHADIDSFSILAAANGPKTSWDVCKVNNYNTTGYAEWHGLMSGYMIEALGWHHSEEITGKTFSVSELNNLVSESFTVHGYSDGEAAVAGPVTIDSLFRYIDPLQKRYNGNSYKLCISGGPVSLSLLF